MRDETPDPQHPPSDAEERGGATADEGAAPAAHRADDGAAPPARPPLARAIPDALRAYADHDPVGADEYVAELWRDMCLEAGVDEPTLRSAINLLIEDGYDGPIEPERCLTDYDGLTWSEAHRIVKAAARAPFPDVEYHNPDLEPVYGEIQDGEEFPEELPNARIEGSWVRASFFEWYRNIYGGLP